MRTFFKRVHEKIQGLHPVLRITIGLLFIVIGILALVTPLTPGSWLAIVGLELLGIHILPWERISKWWSGESRKDAP